MRPYPFPGLQGRFLSEDIGKTSRVKWRGIPWKLPELKGRLKNLTQRQGEDQSSLSSLVGAEDPPV